MKYKLVYSSDADAFEDTINELIEAGWELHGQLQVGPTGIKYQAMTTRKIDPESTD